MEITRNDIMSFVGTLPVSAQLKGRFRVHILEKFPTATQFLVSTEAELKRLRNYGRNMREVVTKVKEEFWQRERVQKDRVLFDERVKETIERLNAENEAMRKTLNPVLTLAELQGIVSMMQLMNLDTIDLATIRKFLDSVRVKREGDKPS